MERAQLTRQSEEPPEPRRSGRRSKAKGANHEREICRKLSLWLSRGERADLFTRNVLSGGLHTRTASGQPGDVAAAHPVSYDFLQVFHVECKHWSNIQVEALLWSDRGKLRSVLSKLDSDARKARRIYILIARQNFRPDLVFMPHGVAYDICDPNQFHHSLWNSTVYATRLSDLVDNDPEPLVRRAKLHLPE